MTLIIGNPGETDDDVKATLDLIYEVERRGLFAFFIPSIFTPLHDTRHGNAERRRRDTRADAAAVADDDEVLEDEPAARSGKLVGAARRGGVGAIGLWVWKLRKMNGPAFTWPLLMFAERAARSG